MSPMVRGFSGYSVLCFHGRHVTTEEPWGTRHRFPSLSETFLKLKWQKSKHSPCFRTVALVHSAFRKDVCSFLFPLMGANPKGNAAFMKRAVTALMQVASFRKAGDPCPSSSHAWYMAGSLLVMHLLWVWTKLRSCTST